MTAPTKQQEALKEAKRQERLRDLLNSNPQVKRRGQLTFTKAAAKEASRKALSLSERALQLRLFDGEREGNHTNN